MAKTVITNTKLGFNTLATMPTTAAIGSDGTAYTAEVDYKGKEDGKILLILENSDTTNAKTATIKKGTMLQGTEDLAKSIAAQTTEIVVIESGKFVNKEGKVVISGVDAKIKVAAIELP